MSWSGYDGAISDPHDPHPLEIEPAEVDEQTEAEIQAHVREAVERVGPWPIDGEPAG